MYSSVIDKLKDKKFAILKGQFRQIRDWWVDQRINIDTYLELCDKLKLKCEQEGFDINKIYKEA